MVHTWIAITWCWHHSGRWLVGKSARPHHLWSLFLWEWLIRYLILHWDHPTKAFLWTKYLSFYFGCYFRNSIFGVICCQCMSWPGDSCETRLCNWLSKRRGTSVAAASTDLATIEISFRWFSLCRDEKKVISNFYF